jgi:acetoin utilization deacetylase AcuC-like enzyme
MIIITDPRCAEYHRSGHPERPSRISRTVEHLRHQQDLPLVWAEPAEVAEEMLGRAHSTRHITAIRQSAEDHDRDTPHHPQIAEHALRSVGGALRALRAARSGQAAFSLLRPPGHHATRDRAMGFCYFNAIAVAALEATAHGIHRVAVFDFDVHHGNGTEDVLEYHPHAAFFSVHQHPCYPGTGLSHVGDNCFNYPVAPQTPRAEYRKVLTRAMNEMARFRPELIAVSAGFDAYSGDPIANELLEAEDFFWLGQSLRRLGVPLFSLLEGGYSQDLPELVLAYLKGVDGR